jgi:starch synthase
MQTLRVLFLAAEADPFIKIGGLGDIAGSLPRALHNLSRRETQGIEIDIRLVIPFHGAIQRQAYPLRTVANFDIPYQDGHTPVEVLHLDMDGLPVYMIGGALIDPDEPVYTQDAAADGLKFAFFSLAALKLARQLDWRPHLLHANDWHTAPAIYALSLIRLQDAFFQETISLLGLHNLPYMGIGADEALSQFGLPPATGSTLPEWAQHTPLALGLLAADHIVAVSPTYAQEILTPQFGSGLDEFLRAHAGKISGILNGIDQERWDPSSDQALAVNYDRQNLSSRLANKTAIQDEFDLDKDARLPLMALVSRMDPQKGVDLLPAALHQLRMEPAYAGRPWQMIILGTGDPTLEAAVRRLEASFPWQVRTAIRFDAALSRRIYAGADMLLIPSRYEPCGLTQMIAMRYGCVPVACATGGLKDTIQDYGQSQDSTGFLFEEPTSEALTEAIGRALNVYSSPNAWQGLQQRGMQRDFSWKRFARQYFDLYHTLTA